MKLRVPVELDVNLQPTEIMLYLRDWVIPILKNYESKGADLFNSHAIVKHNKLYWSYTEESENKTQEIKISDALSFKVCKSAVELLTSFQELLNRDNAQQKDK